MLRSYTLGSLKFLSMTLDRLTDTDSIYRTYYTDTDLTACNIEREQAEITTAMMQSIAHSDVVVIFKIKEDYIQFSMRSKLTSVDHIARYYG